MPELSDLKVVVLHALAGQMSASDDIRDQAAVCERVEAAKASGTGVWLRKDDPARAVYIPSWSVESITMIAIGAPQSAIQTAQGFDPQVMRG